MTVSNIYHLAVNMILLEILKLAQGTSSSSGVDNSSLLDLGYFCYIRFTV